MKKVNEVFFGNHGLTSTSANHLANIAKEKIVSNEAKLKNLNFVTTTVDIVGSPADSGKTISRGYHEEELAEVRALLSEIADMNAFCAWIREAIKAKEAEIKNVTERDFEDWLKENGLRLERPTTGVKPTEDDIIEEMNIRERFEYLQLEATAATIGKYIHPDGVFSNAREELHNRIMKPYSTEGTGKETLIYSYNPSIDQQKVDDLFFDLQKWHRTNEQHLNRIKYDIKRKLDKKSIVQKNQEENALEAYHIEYQEFRSKFKAWQIKESERLSLMKIVIPEDLQAIYETVCSLEK